MNSVTELVVIILSVWFTASIFASVPFIIEFAEYGKRRVPYQIFRSWFEDKNLFGKIYTTIGVILTIPAAIFGMITVGAVFLLIWLGELGKK